MAFLYIIAAVLFLFIVYMLLIAPRCVNKADMSGIAGRIIAHRGMHNNPEIPENSMPAFRLAVEHGYGIEIDLHLTKDGKVVIYHDQRLERVCGVDTRIEDLTYDEVTKLRLFDTEEHPPLFTDFLEMVDGKVPLLIEIKGRDKDTSVDDAAYEILKNYKGDYYIQSFNPMHIRRWRQLEPKRATGLLATDYSVEPDDRKYLFLNTFLENAICRPDFISYDIRYTKNVIFRLIKAVFNPYTAGWTVRTREELLFTRREFDVAICEKLPEIHEAYEHEEE